MPDYRRQDVGDVLDRVLAEERKPKAKKPDVPLSKKQIDVHYDDLYLGYIKKLAEIHRHLKEADKKAANANWSEFRGLKLSEVHVLNAVRYHESYFNAFGKSKRPQIIDEYISKSFGKMSKWEDDFIACGMSTRGWASLAYDAEEQKLINIIHDDHDMGVCNIHPILMLDMKEHAYMIDFGANKPKYIDLFMDNINWEVVVARLTEYE